MPRVMTSEFSGPVPIPSAVAPLDQLAAHEVGLGAEIAAVITDRCFYSLEAPPQRVAGFNTPYPPAKLEEHFVPDLDRILDAVDRTVGRENSLTGFVAR